MKMIETVPIISEMVVIFNGLNYNGKIVNNVHIRCDMDGTVHQAIKDDEEKPFFVMGASYWDEHLGKKQSNQIKKMCLKASKDLQNKLIQQLGRWYPK